MSTADGLLAVVRVGIATGALDLHDLRRVKAEVEGATDLKAFDEIPRRLSRFVNWRLATLIQCEDLKIGAKALTAPSGSPPC